MPRVDIKSVYSIQISTSAYSLSLLCLHVTAISEAEFILKDSLICDTYVQFSYCVIDFTINLIQVYI